MTSLSILQKHDGREVRMGNIAVHHEKKGFGFKEYTRAPSKPIGGTGVLHAVPTSQIENFFSSS